MISRGKTQNIVAQTVRDIMRNQHGWVRKGLKWAKREGDSDILLHLLPSKIRGSGINPYYFPDLYISYRKFRHDEPSDTASLFHKFDEYQINIRTSDISNCYNNIVDIDSKLKNEKLYDMNENIDDDMRIKSIRDDFNKNILPFCAVVASLEAVFSIYADGKLPLYAFQWLEPERWLDEMKTNKKAQALFRAEFYRN